MRIADGQTLSLNRSKSVLIRQLLVHYLYKHQLLDVREPDANDAKIVHRCLCEIENSRNKPPVGSVRIDVEDCGAAYRFFMAVLSVEDGNWLLTGTPRLLQRPIAPLVEALRSIGADIQQVTDGWLIFGKSLHAEQMTIDCALSSQFASALWLISDKIGLHTLTVSPESPPSAPYISLTQKILRDALAGKSLLADGDWSSAAFWYAYAALAPQIQTLRLANLDLQSPQGDCYVAELFENFGIFSEQVGRDVIIRKTAHPAIGKLQLDLSNTPDIVPVMAAFAILYPIDLQIVGVKNLNLKESRRVDVLSEELSWFAPVSIENKNSLQIYGNQKIINKTTTHTLSSHDDHRIVMAFSLLKLQYNVKIDGTECVRKSYPDFLDFEFSQEKI